MQTQNRFAVRTKAGWNFVLADTQEQAIETIRACQRTKALEVKPVADAKAFAALAKGASEQQRRVRESVSMKDQLERVRHQFAE